MFFRKRSAASGKEPQAQLTREQALACRPVPCPIVDVEDLSDDQVRLCYPLSLKPWFARLAGRFGMWDGRPRMKRLELDAMGTTVWRLMDGSRSVEDVIDAFAARYGLEWREAELSVSAFIKDLGRRGLVGLRQSASEAKGGTRNMRKKGKKAK